MSNENQPLQTDSIVNDNENLNIDPELQSKPNEASDNVANEDDNDTGGSNPSPDKERG